MKIRESQIKSTEINRLLAAAVINRSFCNLLLKDAARAIKEGFAGESFLLSNEEYDLVVSIRAASLPEFANELCRHLSNYRPPAQHILPDDL
jgi:hypothetical protein